jgi:hypothetical protein
MGLAGLAAGFFTGFAAGLGALTTFFAAVFAVFLAGAFALPAMTLPRC